MTTGRKTVVVGQVIDPVAWGNPLWDQSVQTFASAADRTAQFPNPLAGAVTWLDDVKDLQVYTGAGGWRSVDPLATYIAPTYNAAYGPTFPQGLVLEKRGRTITIAGGITNLTATTWTATQKLSIANVPAGWRPASGVWVANGTFLVSGGANIYLARLEIDAAGLVIWQPTQSQVASTAPGTLTAFFDATILQAVP